MEMLSNVIFYKLYYFTFHILVYSSLLSMYGRGQGYCLWDIQMDIQLAKYHSFLKSPFPIVLRVTVVLCHRCICGSLLGFCCLLSVCPSILAAELHGLIVTL